MLHKIIKAQGGIVHYFTNNIENRTTLFFCHGLTADHTIFEKQYEYFKDKYNLILLDIPMHGLSYPYKNFSYRDCADIIQSILIKENIHKGNSTQSSKIKTYNYNLNNNTEVGIMDIVEAKNYKQKDIQKEIDTEIEALNKKDEEIKTQYSEVKLRDLNNSMYKIENTENFIINDQGYLYLIYAYGNTEDTNKIDTIIFE